ncbi:Sugar-phosphate isomerase, RpiB/LacA/LacB family like protein, partial [Aduncisulcus paluster]
MDKLLSCEIILPGVLIAKHKGTGRAILRRLTMKIAMGSDHGALNLKKAVKTHLEAKGHEVIDFGTHTADSCDYPVYGKIAAEAVASGECDCGIIMCGTGIGISLAANKVKGIRCAV